MTAQAALRLADVDPQAIGGAFDGTRHVRVQRAAQFVIRNRSTRHARAGVVPMTGTINADDRRRRLPLRSPATRFPGSSSKARCRPHQARRRLAQHDERPRPRPRQRHWRGRRHRAHARLLDRRHHARDPWRDRCADDARRLVQVSGDQHHRHRRRRRPPLLGRVRASASVVANTRLATISAIDLRRGTAAITGDVVADITNRDGTASCTSRRRMPPSCRTTVPEAWRVPGPLSADAILGGTFDNYTLDTTISGSGAALGGTADRSRDGEGDGHCGSDRRDVAAVAPGRGIPRRPRPLCVGHRRLHRKPQGRSALVAGHRCFRRTIRRRSSRCSSTAPARPRSQRDS